MSMHLVGPWLSTTGKKKGKKKWASAEHKRKAEQADLEWKELQKKWGIESESKKRNRSLTAEVWKPKPDIYRRETQKYNSLPFTGEPCLKKEPNKYTGTLIKGIATMHKSNAVPIINDQEAIDISKMRR
jgi:hypothetical protein